MSRLPQIAVNEATPEQAELFAAAKAKLGLVPNMLRALGNSTAALKGYLQFSGVLATGKGLSARQREIIALTVGEANGCEYCLAAHSTLGKLAGLTPEQIEAARRGEGDGSADAAVARFARQVLAVRGRVSDDQLSAFHEAGFSDEAVAEVVAHVALNVYTNFFNNVAETDVDFPAAEPLADSSCSTSCVSHA